MPLPDNRIRLPAVKIDFDTEVGTTSQDHDTYPAPQAQARYDHMRMYLIGLLSQQSSYSEPTQKRDGTPWFDLNTLALKIWLNGEWQLYSAVIPLTVGTQTLTLADWYATVNESLVSLAPEVVFGGKADSVTSDITIPSALRSALYDDSRAFIVVNGTSIDPRSVTFIGSPTPTIIRMANHELEANDEFYVTIRRVPVTTFSTSDVIVP